jgi:hypothetical protein
MHLSHLRHLVRDTRALAAVEFALSMPLLITLCMGGVEVTNYALTVSRVNQIAISIADNASRAKLSVVGAAPQFREYDVGETFTAANLAYPGMKLYTDGRVILSSLETNSSGGQWIHWQRCRGSKSAASKYGVQGTGITGTSFAGMGPSGNVVTAESGAAIMFVEVYYDYTPLMLSSTKTTIYRSAAMYVRDDRDLTQIYNPTPTATVYSC